MDKPQPIRHAEIYGNLGLNIQGSKYHYSTPREDGLPLGEYIDLEVGFLFNGELFDPSDHLPPDLLEKADFCGSVAGYVPASVVEEIRSYLRDRVVIHGWPDTRHA